MTAYAELAYAEFACIMRPMKKRFGKDSPTPAQLKKLREKCGLTQSDAASILHVSLRTWQNWEAGKYEMFPAFWQVFQEEAPDWLMSE